MKPSEVRVRLPAGSAFTEAFCDGARKYGARQGMDPDRTTALVELVRAGVEAVDTADPEAIELLLGGEPSAGGTKHVRVEVVGIGPASSMTATAKRSLAGGFAATVSAPASVMFSIAVS